MLEPMLPTASSTRTLCGPIGKAGATASIRPEFTTLMLDRPRPPRVTVAAGWKFDPRTVTGVPPDDGPEFGAIEITPGASACPRMTFGSPTSACTTTPFTLAIARPVRVTGGVNTMS